jgi:hypothetical protein
MKRLFFILFLLVGFFTVQNNAQTYTLYANKVAITDVAASRTRTVYNYVVFTIAVDENGGIMHLSTGASYIFGDRQRYNSEHYVFTGYNTENNAKGRIHFFLRSGVVVKLVIEHTDYIFTYTKR